MIDIYEMENGKVAKTEEIKEGVWINMVNPSVEEIDLVQKELGIEREALTAALDDEEGSRVEMSPEYTIILIDAPTREWRNGHEEFTTYPISITVTDTAVITVCLQPLFAITSLLTTMKKTKNAVNLTNKSRFVLQILFRIAVNYQSDLKYIEVKRNAIEESIRRSTKREDLFELHELESNLVYFRTSLAVNVSIIDRISKQARFLKTEEDREIMDDVIIETNQALEMTNTYSEIIKGTRQLVESDLNNSLAKVMKFLTSITLIISIPTMIASIYGMNVVLPGNSSPYTILIIFGIMVVMCIVAISILRKSDMWR